MGLQKMLFFDVDGTLLNEQHEIPASAQSALRQARQNGHMVFINSGRSSGLLQQLTERIEVDGILCGCGTEIIAEGREIYSYTLPDEVVKHIVELVPGMDIDYILEGKDGVYFRPERSRFPEVEQTREFVKQEDGLAKEPFVPGRSIVSKFCIQADARSDIDAFYREFSQWFDIIDRGGGFYECVPLGHSKGTAILEVLRQYNVPLEDAYVFGDSTNDIGMFEVCENCIAMGRHDEALAPYASFVTKDVDDDGIAYALEHFGIV